MKEPGIAFIGCGFAARTHARALRWLIDNGHTRASLVVACDSKRQRAERLAEQFGFVRTETDALRAIRSPDVSTVYILTPTAGHPALVQETAGASKAIFCEKPLACRLPEVEEMVHTVTTAGIQAQVGLVLRYSPVFLLIRQLMQGAAPEPTGPLMTATMRDDQSFPITDHYGSTWRADAGTSGGGTLIEHSIHDIDLMRWLFGEIESVFARTASFSAHSGIEDTASVILDFRSGATATLTSVWHDVLQRPSDRMLEIFCRNAWIRASHDFIGAVELQQGQSTARLISEEEVVARYLDSMGRPSESADELSNAYVQENLAFLRALSSGEDPSPSFQDALTAHDIIDAIYRSARSGRVEKSSGL